MAVQIALIGPMGAGKSTVGRKLAERLGWEFVDSDSEIEARCGASISLIFELEGEAGFRRRERQVIEELCRRRGVVLATGGGAVLDPANRQALRDAGLVVYLRASVQEQFRRTRHDTARPLLQTEDPLGRLAAMFDLRDPLYRDTAHVIIDTDGATPAAAVTEILEALAEFAPSGL